MSIVSKINDLTPSQWLFRSKSVMRRTFGLGADAHKIRKAFNKACKPPALCRDIVENFSKKDDVVLDPFAGTGGIILGAQMAGRKAMGCEIDPKQAQAYREACIQMSSLFTDYDQDAVKTCDFFEAYAADSSPIPFVDFLFTDPPYFDMDRRPKSLRWFKGKGSQQRPMEPFEGCLFKGIDAWKTFMSSFASRAMMLVKDGRYMAYFMEDAYLSGRYVFLTHISAEIVESHGWIPQGEYIWYNEGRRPGFFGFPSKMITNRTHTSLLFFLHPGKREKEKKDERNETNGSPVG